MVDIYKNLVQDMLGAPSGAVSTGSTIPARAANLAVLSDSRGARGYFRGMKVADVLTKSTWFASVQGVGPAITSDGTGTLEYRVSDRKIRWTAQGDTAGAWQDYVAGWQYVQSGSADKWLALAKMNSSYPTANITTSLAYSGSVYMGWEHHGFVPHMLAYLRSPWGWKDMKFLGIGAQTVVDAATILDYYTAESSGPGLDIILLGTNDITDGNSLATMKQAMWALLESRWHLGRFTYLIGESARFAVSTTALSADQLTTLLGWNAFLADIAAKYPDRAKYFDVYSRTKNPALLDGSPITTAGSAALADHVHYSVYLAMRVGMWVAKDLLALGLISKGPIPHEEDPDNLGFSNCNFQSTTAATDASASGLKPTGGALLRSAGTDATVAGSQTADADNEAEQWFTMTVAQGASAASQTIKVSGPVMNLAANSLVVGDYITLELEYEIVSVTDINSIEVYLTCNGSSPLQRRSLHKLNTTANVGIAAIDAPMLLRSFPMVIPTGTTDLDLNVDIVLAASASAAAVVRVRNFKLKKYMGIL